MKTMKYLESYNERNSMNESEEVQDANEWKAKIEKVLEDNLPKLAHKYVRITNSGSSNFIDFGWAASNYEINKVKGMFPQHITFRLRLNEMLLEPFRFGFKGGTEVNRVVLPTDKYQNRVSAGERIKFRKPKGTEKAILKALKTFIERWIAKMKEFQPHLLHSDVVDYAKLLK